MRRPCPLWEREHRVRLRPVPQVSCTRRPVRERATACGPRLRHSSSVCHNTATVSCTVVRMASTSAIPTRGLRHLALNVADVSASVEFYSSLFGMRVVWQPDPDNAYLSSGCDNLALHRAAANAPRGGQRLDHLGFIVETAEDVDHAAEALAARHIPLLRPPRTHRDGSRSLYLTDPDGNVIQILYEPTLSTQRLG